MNLRCDYGCVVPLLISPATADFKARKFFGCSSALGVGTEYRQRPHQLVGLVAQALGRGA